MPRRSTARALLEHRRPVVAVLALVWTVAVALMAVVLLDARDDSRLALEHRFADRVDTAAKFMSESTSQLLDDQALVARNHLSGRKVSQRAFEQAASDLGAATAVLLDAEGRVRRITPADPSVVGRPFGDEYPHLGTAVRGRRAVSAVVPTVTDGRRIVAFAVPIASAAGLRVFSTGHAVGGTPLGMYVQNGLPIPGGRMTLVDRRGTVIASSVDPHLLGAEPGLRPGFAGMVDDDRFAAAATVPNTPWRVVASAPASGLYAPTDGTAEWAPWLVLAVLAGAGLAAIWLLARLMRTRQALQADIRERVVAERALADAEARQRAILRSLPDAAVLSFDADLRYTGAKGLALASIGWSAEELVGHRLQDVVSEERRATLEPAYRAALAGETTRLEFRSERSGRLVETECAPVRSARGDIIGGLAVTRDVTEQREADQRRREAEERFRTAFEQAPIGMAMVALDGGWLRVNAELCAMLGYSREDLLGTSFAAVTHPDDLDADLELVQRCLDGELDRYQLEKRYLRRNGQELAATLSVSLVRDGAGRALYFLSQVVDVTERRRGEERLAHLAAHDPLTGLLNRRTFGEELERQTALTRRGGAPASVLMLDLDRFKRVNDTFGHAAGDALLVRVAAVLRDRLRASDVIARLGGDEFAVLLPETSAGAAEVVGRDLVDAIARATADRVGETLGVTASVGVAAIDPDGIEVAGAVLLTADAALYDAKAAGRGGVSAAAGVRV